jgi:integrin alpha FG-GAP repeat containing protein 1
VFSVPCSRGVAGCNADGSGRRGWKVVTHGAQSLEGVTDARGVAFLDMDEDVCCFYFVFRTRSDRCFGFLQGTLDMMVQRTGDGGQGNVLFVQNNFYYDAFFLKAIGMFFFQMSGCLVDL